MYSCVGCHSCGGIEGSLESYVHKSFALGMRRADVAEAFVTYKRAIGVGRTFAAYVAMKHGPCFLQIVSVDRLNSRAIHVVIVHGFIGE